MTPRPQPDPHAASGRKFGRGKRWLLLRLLGQYAQALEAQGKDAARDSVYDLMDAVYGWCRPSRRLD